jgi:riboflavin synthase
LFTGLVQAVGTLEAAQSTAAGARLWVHGPWNDLATGESIAVDGVCLTVAAHDGAGTFEADASSETLARSTLGRFAPGARLHLERALRAGDRLGGHFVAGHVDAVGTITDVRPAGGGTRVLTVRVPRGPERQLAAKGSVAIDGVSLTINAVRDCEFEVMIVPHTAAATRLGEAAAGAAVNVETDLLAKYVERATGADAGGGVTEALLARSGFLGGGDER